MTPPPQRKAELKAEAQAFLDAHPEIEKFSMLYTDLPGAQRGKLLTREELVAAWGGGRCFPGSVLGMDITGRDVDETGLVWEDGDADRLVWPVSGTLVPTPWAIEPSAQYLGSYYELDDSPSVCEPRHALQRVIAQVLELGLTPVAAVELEFYLMDRDSALAGNPKPPKGLTTPAVPKHFQAYFMTDLDDFAPYFRDLYAAMKVQGIPAEALISEYSPGQMEIGLRHHNDVLRACDEAIMFKRAVKGIAERHGMIATFMAKPYSAYAGSGMHLHLSLADGEGRNAFASDDPQPNDLLRHAIGGMKAAMADAMAIFAPNANSYRRFRRSSYAPLTPNWGINNRTVALRIPASSGAARHVEHRAAGADANPYLAMAAVLAGAHHGITNRIDPGPATVGNGYEQPGEAMPSNWFSALETFRRSALMRQYFGDRFVDVFATLKEIEADRFFAEPQPLDFDFYLRTV